MKREDYVRQSHFRCGLLSLLCLSIAVFLSGCGGLKLVPVEGKVTAGNAPVPKGEVIYWPQDTEKSKDKREIKGTIGADGSYKMTTNGKTGVPPGPYKVTINAMDLNPTATDMSGGLGGAPPKAAAPPRSYVNQKYNDPNTTDINITVTENPQPGQYDLKATR